MILIRADANPGIGMGHIMRCLSIADSCKTAGHEVAFILADDVVEKLINQRGYQGIILHSDYREMEKEQWPEIKAEIIIVDSYHVTPAYLKSLQQNTDYLVYIDDLNAFLYPVDLVINYNAYGPYLDYESMYAGKDKPEFILGTTFTPLRAMFRGVEKKKQKREVENILISTGGSDPEHIAWKLVRAEPRNHNYHILLGAMNPDKEEIKKLAEDNDKIILHENVSDMKSLICDMDIAVSAAGSTLYEISACGVPLITYVLADNQIPGADAFERLGLAMNLGDMREAEDSSKKITSAIEELAKDYDKRIEVGTRMQEMIDGYGADRMVERILYFARTRN